jgi:hypothetical protein
MGVVNGLSVKEALFQPPGLLFDMFDVYLEANGLKREKDNYSEEYDE